MTHRFLAFLLAGILAVAALDGFELQNERNENAIAPDDSGLVTAMDGVGGYPPGPKKAF